MKKDLAVQVIAGLVTLIFGVGTLRYGIRFYADETKGNVRTCLLLLLCCAVSVAVSVIISVKNAKKYRNKN